MIDKSLSETTIGNMPYGADGTISYSVFPGIEFSFVDVHGHCSQYANGKSIERLTVAG